MQNIWYLLSCGLEVCSNMHTNAMPQIWLSSWKRRCWIQLQVFLLLCPWSPLEGIRPVACMADYPHSVALKIDLAFGDVVPFGTAAGLPSSTALFSHCINYAGDSSIIIMQYLVYSYCTALFFAVAKWLLAQWSNNGSQLTWTQAGGSLVTRLSQSFKLSQGFFAQCNVSMLDCCI